ncbi:MAG: threonine--tRNA ligase, partial [Lachnospiraceae bacterium]|nr:threonine--tRNA ligase [Lachnospiraceae bacterium]
DYAGSVVKALTDAGLRCELDTRDEKIGYKIREAQLEKVPYMLIVGQKEEESKTVSVRKRDEGDIGAMTLDEFENKTKED